MDAPTTAQEIKAAYKALYNASANALDAQRAVNAKRYALKDAEATLTTSGALEAGKNAETRAAILTGLTGVDRLALRLAEEDLAAAEREQALAKTMDAGFIIGVGRIRAAVIIDAAARFTRQQTGGGRADIGMM